MRDAPTITGLAIDDQNRVLVGLSIGTAIIGMSPEEMRAFAGHLLAAADALEAEAADAASAAISKAGRIH